MTYGIRRWRFRPRWSGQRRTLFRLSAPLSRLNQKHYCPPRTRDTLHPLRSSCAAFLFQLTLPPRTRAPWRSLHTETSASRPFLSEQRGTWRDHELRAQQEEFRKHIHGASLFSFFCRPRTKTQGELGGTESLRYPRAPWGLWESVNKQLRGEQERELSVTAQSNQSRVITAPRNFVLVPPAAGAARAALCGKRRPDEWIMSSSNEARGASPWRCCAHFHRRNIPAAQQEQVSLDAIRKKRVFFG